ncbi:MAG: hypothetical protein BWY87_00250 [Deltaproteobacteria bacterium ADurb.Bin510]|nr:MAG: hypothetical protein BWY87_00250 [Deltaproteobacteria bacterium ADurb.Bin510]
MRRSLALRTVKPAWKWSPSRTSGATPGSSMSSWVVVIEALPLPKRPAPWVATPTILKALSESLSLMSKLASPRSSSLSSACQYSRVSKSSRVSWRPPPPPAATALSPKWRLPTTIDWAVDVLTAQPRRLMKAARICQVGLSASSSRPSSTAATLKYPPLAG